MFWRAVLAFLALPGLVIYAIPLWMASRQPTNDLAHPLGAVLVLVGSAGLLYCVRDFYVAGKGTIAPWSPPRELVVVGLYRYSRNPIYVADSLILLGWAAMFGSGLLLGYALAISVAFHLRVVYGEEPWLAKTHGAAWQAYCRRVPRWLRWPPWRHSEPGP